jgi:hypothetical protein
MTEQDLAELRQKLVTETARTKAIKAAGGKSDMTRQFAMVGAIVRAENAPRESARRMAALSASVAKIAPGPGIPADPYAATPHERLQEALEALAKAEADVEKLTKKPPSTLADAVDRLNKAKKEVDAAQKAMDSQRSRQ